ncbi:phosphotransferase [Halobacteriovorax sp. HLS]|uniref:phosphotransferase n=1 Tax=Halobacteriovorax sp. HLS TaxID=2234000 RepID=UPI000FDBB966|nr:phosphotransferase [Halobacteriovorax sp. HLS]
MGDYTKLSINDASEILEIYALGPASELKSLSLGISNSNYLVVSNDSKYLLKVSNDKGQGDLEKEQDILMLLHNENFELSLTPFTTIENKTVYTWKDFFGVLYPFVEGIAPGPCDQTCFEIGRGLARLHKVKVDETKVRAHNEVGFGGVEIAEYIKTDRCPEDFKEIVEYFFPESLDAFNALTLEKGIIHGDLYYDNTLFDANHLAVILDFEQAGYGEYLFDLGISISGTCLEKDRINKNLINSYLKGYEEIRPLCSIEKENLNSAIVLGLLSISRWRIKRFKEGKLNPLMSDSYKELLNKAKLFWDDRN